MYSNILSKQYLDKQIWAHETGVALDRFPRKGLGSKKGKREDK